MLKMAKTWENVYLKRTIAAFPVFCDMYDLYRRAMATGTVFLGSLLFVLKCSLNVSLWPLVHAVNSSSHFWT